MIKLLSRIKKIKCVEYCWNDSNMRKRKYSDKICPSVSWFTTNPTRTGMGLNPNLRHKRPATNRPNCYGHILLSFVKEWVLRRDEVTGEWRRLHNEELNDLYSSPNIVRLTKPRMRWAGHVARMGEERGAYRVLVGKPEGKRPLGRPRMDL